MYFFAARDAVGTVNNIFYDVVEIGKLKAFISGSISHEMDIKNVEFLVKIIFRYVLKRVIPLLFVKRG